MVSGVVMEICLKMKWPGLYICWSSNVGLEISCGFVCTASGRLKLLMLNSYVMGPERGCREVTRSATVGRPVHQVARLINTARRQTRAPEFGARLIKCALRRHPYISPKTPVHPLSVKTRTLATLQPFASYLITI